MARVLEAAGLQVLSTDISAGQDFLLAGEQSVDAIVTNPPYISAKRFIEHALRLTSGSGKVVMLLRTDFDHAKTRRHLFSDCPAFACKIVLTKRIRWIDNSTGCRRIWAPTLFTLGAVLPHGVIRFQHRRKISSILIQDTVAPIAIHTTSGSCSLRDVKSPKAGAVMSIIPLDLQRRCERRWAARFSRPIPSATPRNQRPVRESLQIAEPAKPKEKPAGLERRA